MMLLSVDWASTFVLVGFGFAMVSIILWLLVYLLLLFQKIMSPGGVRKMMPEQASTPPVVKTDDRQADIADIAAISAALSLYMQEIHDKESNIITIRNLTKQYSPWNSKIYGLMSHNKTGKTR